MTAAPKITAQSWLMICVLGLAWGGSFLAIELGLRGMSPFWLAAARVLMGAVLAAAVWRALGGRLFERPPPVSARVNLMVAGMLSTAVPFTLLTWGQQYVTSGFAGVSMASVALIVLPLAHFLLPGERLTPGRAAGFLVGFVGVVVLIGGQALHSTGAAFELPGRLACVGAACCYAISSVQLRKLPAIDPIGVTAMLLICGAVVLVPLAWLVEGPPPLPDQSTLLVVLYMGLVPTAAMNLLRVLVVRTAGPVFMSLVNYQVPVWSVLLGAFFLSEELPASLTIAMILILAGVALSQWTSLKRLFA